MLRHPHDHFEIFADDEIPGDDEPSFDLSRGRRVADDRDIHISSRDGEMCIPWELQERFMDVFSKLHGRCKARNDDYRRIAAANQRRAAKDLLREHNIIPTDARVEKQLEEMESV